MLSVEDRLDITQLLNLYGHVIDLREWDRLGELFTEDLVFDAPDFGHAPFHGLEALRTDWLYSDKHPLAHHATNILIWEDPDGTVRAQCKGIGVGFKGRVGTLTYKDVLRRTSAGWRIARREAMLVRPQPRSQRPGGAS